MDIIDIIIKRANSLEKSGVYTGTIFEFDLSDLEYFELSKKYKVLKRN